MQIFTSLKALWNNISFLREKKFLNYSFLFIFISVIYTLWYFHYPNTPGNRFDVVPAGWWAWFDQEIYLKNARNIAQWQFPQELWYPVLYPAVGALFLSVSSGHPFFFINLLCLLWFFYVFVQIGERYFSRIWIICLFFVTIIFQTQMLEQFIIPWTTTLCTAFISTGFLALLLLDDIDKGYRQKFPLWWAFLISFILGLIVATRPQDAIIGVITAIFLLYKWITLRNAGKKISSIPLLITVSITGAIIGPILYFGHHYLISQSFEVLYLLTGLSFSDLFPIADIPEKFISLFLNGYPLYQEVETGIFFRQLWLFVGVPGLCWVLLKGTFILRCIATCIFISIAFIYIPYFDLIPHGLWRWWNFHYFIWTFPYLALFALLILQDIIKYKNKYLLIFLIIFPLLLLSLDIKIIYTRLIFNQEHNILSARLPDKEIDFIDINIINQHNRSITVYCFEEVRIDDKKLNLAQTRCFPIKDGIRLLFVRPVKGKIIKLTLFSDIGPLNANTITGTYDIVFSYPHMPSTTPPPPFSQNENAYLSGTLPFFPLHEKKSTTVLEPSEITFSSGWSAKETWGLWTSDNFADFFLSPPPEADRLILYGHPFLGGLPGNQQIIVYINGKKVCTKNLTKEEETQISIKLPREAVESRLLHVQLELPNAFSPQSIHMSGDTRKLGFGFTALCLQ